MKIESEFVELALSGIFSKEFGFAFSQKAKDKVANHLSNQLNLIVFFLGKTEKIA